LNTGMLDEAYARQQLENICASMARR
jgi:hypothetical protein